MANIKITELTADTAPTHDDLIVTVNDPGGTPANRKVTIANLWAALAKMVFAEDAGANDTYTATLSPAPAAYVTGQHYRFKANTANTGAATVNFNGLGAKTIKKAAGGITTDLDDNDIRAGQWVDLVYDGTNMQMQSQLGNAPAGGAGGFAASGANADITSMTGLTGALKAPTQIQDSNSNEVLVFGSTASAVNEVKVTNKATGTGPTIEATGGDTNINLNLVSKGTGVVQANGNELAIKTAEINAQTGTTYTLQASDNGKVVTCSNASAITVTVPSGLGAGFNCLVVQIGAGQVAFSASSTTINNRQSHTKIAGQYGVASLVAYSSNVFALGGDTAA